MIFNNIYVVTFGGISVDDQSQTPAERKSAMKKHHEQAASEKKFNRNDYTGFAHSSNRNDHGRDTVRNETKCYIYYH